MTIHDFSHPDISRTDLDERRPIDQSRIIDPSKKLPSNVRVESQLKASTNKGDKALKILKQIGKGVSGGALMVVLFGLGLGPLNVGILLLGAIPVVGIDWAEKLHGAYALSFVMIVDWIIDADKNKNKETPKNQPGFKVEDRGAKPPLDFNIQRRSSGPLQSRNIDDEEVNPDEGILDDDDEPSSLHPTDQKGKASSTEELSAMEKAIQEERKRAKKLQDENLERK